MSKDGQRQIFALLYWNNDCDSDSTQSNYNIAIFAQKYVMGYFKIFVGIFCI